jgi:hypothetical protein
MSISFNLDPPIRYLLDHAEVYTLRSKKRPLGRQVLYFKHRRAGFCTVERVDLAAEGWDLMRHHLWSGYRSEGEWFTAAMGVNGDRCDLGGMGVFKVKIDPGTRKRLRMGGERWL